MADLEPAATIIRILGGVGAVAAILGVNRTTVQRMKVPSDGGSKGSDGDVPRKHRQALIDAARIKGIDLRPADFAWPGASPLPQILDRNPGLADRREGLRDAG